MKTIAIVALIATAFVSGMFVGKKQESKLHAADIATWTTAAKPLFDGYSIPSEKRTSQTLHSMLRPGLPTNVLIRPDVWEIDSLVTVDRPNFNDGYKHKPVF